MWPNRDVDLETFEALDQPTRNLILRMIDEPTDDDHAELRDHPNGRMLASWLLELPAYGDVVADA